MIGNLFKNFRRSIKSNSDGRIFCAFRVICVRNLFSRFQLISLAKSLTIIASTLSRDWFGPIKTRTPGHLSAKHRRGNPETSSGTGDCSRRWQTPKKITQRPCGFCKSVFKVCSKIRNCIMTMPWLSKDLVGGRKRLANGAGLKRRLSMKATLPLLRSG